MPTYHLSDFEEGKGVQVTVPGGVVIFYPDANSISVDDGILFIEIPDHGRKRTIKIVYPVSEWIAVIDFKEIP